MPITSRVTDPINVRNDGGYRLSPTGRRRRTTLTADYCSRYYFGRLDSLPVGRVSRRGHRRPMPPCAYSAVRARKHTRLRSVRGCVIEVIHLEDARRQVHAGSRFAPLTHCACATLSRIINALAIETFDVPLST